MSKITAPPVHCTGKTMLEQFDVRLEYLKTSNLFKCKYVCIEAFETCVYFII